MCSDCDKVYCDKCYLGKKKSKLFKELKDDDGNELFFDNYSKIKCLSSERNTE